MSLLGLYSRGGLATPLRIRVPVCAGGNLNSNFSRTPAFRHGEAQEQEESYTSKASFLDADELPVYNADNPQKYNFSGKRIHRGMYQSKTGIKINADVNGALNILRKSNVVSLEALYSSGVASTPMRIRLA